MNLVVIVESMRSIVDHGGNELKEFHLPSLIAVGAALGGGPPCVFELEAF